MYNFNEALDLLKDSKKVSRSWWENKETYLFRMSGDNPDISEDEIKWNISDKGSYMVIKNKQWQSKLWNATEEDKNSSDWVIKNFS